MSIALGVTPKSYPGIPLFIIQSDSISTIGNVPAFFNKYQDTGLDRDLLFDLVSYAYKRIKNSRFPLLRVQCNNKTIGRSHRILLKNTSLHDIAEALRWNNKYKTELEIERYKTFCKTIFDYARQYTRSIKELNTTDFDQVRQLYSMNRAKFEYLSEVNKDKKDKKDKLTFDTLNSFQRSEIDNLCQELSNELPLSLSDKLDDIAAAVYSYMNARRSGGTFVKSIEQTILPDEGGNSTTLGEILNPEAIPQLKIIPYRTTQENRDLLDIVRPGMSSYYNDLKARDRKIILYLCVHFELTQEEIAFIIKIDQAGISKKLKGTKATRKIKESKGIYKEIKEDIIKKIIDNNHNFNEQDIRLMINETINSSSRSDSNPGFSNVYYQELEQLIIQYKAYSKYLKLMREKLKKKDRNLALILKNIKGEDYAKQFDYLALLNREEYPESRSELNTSSFLELRDNIVNILDRKLEDSLDELYN